MAPRHRRVALDVVALQRGTERTDRRLEAQRPLHPRLHDCQQLSGITAAPMRAVDEDVFDLCVIVVTTIRDCRIGVSDSHDAGRVIDRRIHGPQAGSAGPSCCMTSITLPNGSCT